MQTALTIRKKVKYAEIARFIASLPKPMSMARAKQKAISRLNQLRKGLNGEQVERAKETHYETMRAFVAQLLAGNTKQDLARLVSEKYNVKCSVKTIDNIKAMDAKELNKKNLATYEERSPSIAASALASLRALFVKWYKSDIFDFVPQCDKAELTPDGIVFLRETDNTITKDCTRTYQVSDGEKTYSISLSKQITVADTEEKTRKVKISIPCKYEYGFSYSNPFVEYVWHEGNKTTGEKGYIDRVTHVGNVVPLNIPIEYKEETTEETYVETKKRFSVTHCDKEGKAKVRETATGIKIENAGKFIAGRLVRYLSSLFEQYEQDIPEDKAQYFKVQGKVFKTFNKHVPRFGLFDCINDACLELWSEMIQREANHEKRYDLEEMNQRAKYLLRLAFATRFDESKRLDAVTTGISYENGEEISEEREASALSYATEDYIASHAFVPIYEMSNSENGEEKDALMSERVPSSKHHSKDVFENGGRISRAYLDLPNVYAEMIS